jgi:hypothetical protein
VSASLPHYVLTLTNKGPTEFLGWLYFVYQDGRTAPIFHYDATVRTEGITLKTDTSSEPFQGAGARRPRVKLVVPQFLRAGLTLVHSQRTPSPFRIAGRFSTGRARIQGRAPAQSCTFSYSAS